MTRRPRLQRLRRQSRWRQRPPVRPGAAPAAAVPQRHHRNAAIRAGAGRAAGTRPGTHRARACRAAGAGAGTGEAGSCRAGAGSIDHRACRGECAACAEARHCRRQPKEKATVEATVTDKPVDADWARTGRQRTRKRPRRRRSRRRTSRIGYSPVGDWQTEGKRAWCESRNAARRCAAISSTTPPTTTGETVLINMKPKTDTQWTGGIYSRASGNTYYGTMTIKRPDTLRVEACAIGRFYLLRQQLDRVRRRRRCRDRRGRRCRRRRKS